MNLLLRIVTEWIHSFGKKSVTTPRSFIQMQFPQGAAYETPPVISLTHAHENINRRCERSIKSFPFL